jgi:hypothetical protein
MNEDYKINLFIGTPAYNSMVHTDYMHSLISYYEYKIPFSIMTVGNESLITRGRNTVMSYFYRTVNFSHLLYLDADIYLHAEELLRLISHKKDVIGAPVNLKGFDAQGNPVSNVGKILEECEDGLLKVEKVGTAILMLSRNAVDALVEEAKSSGDVYKPNPHTRGQAASFNMYDVFKTGVFEGEYDSEDYYVCRVLRKLGFDIYVDPTVQNRHSGMYVF